MPRALLRAGESKSWYLGEGRHGHIFWEGDKPCCWQEWGLLTPWDACRPALGWSRGSSLPGSFSPRERSQLQEEPLPPARARGRSQFQCLQPWPNQRLCEEPTVLGCVCPRYCSCSRSPAWGLYLLPALIPGQIHMEQHPITVLASPCWLRSSPDAAGTGREMGHCCISQFRGLR